MNKQSTELQPLPGYKVPLVPFKDKNEIIVAFENPKIRDYPEGIKNANIALLLRDMFHLLAVKNTTKEEANAMHLFIDRRLDSYTFQEINTACELYAAGQLNYEGQALQPFQSLNAVVLGRVMKAYASYKNEDNKFVRYLTEKTRAAYKENTSTQEQKDKLFKQLIYNCFKQWKEEKTHRAGSHVVYDYLVDAGLIDMEDFSPEENLRKAQKQVRQQAAKFTEDGKFINYSPPGAKTLSKAKALCCWFDTMDHDEFVEFMAKNYKPPADV